MSYMPTFTDYLKVLTDEKVKDFVIINFGESFFCFFLFLCYILLHRLDNFIICSDATCPIISRSVFNVLKFAYTVFNCPTL